MDDRERRENEAVEEPSQVVGPGLRVGAYEGLRAGEAIVAVRDRGLRPSLERVEGYAEARHGFVVSQEPSAGSEVAADSQVFLYIGSPPRVVALGHCEAAGDDALDEEATSEANEPTAERLTVEEPTVEEPRVELSDCEWDELEDDVVGAAPTAEERVEDEAIEEGPVEEAPDEDEVEEEWLQQPPEPVQAWRAPAAAQRPLPRGMDQTAGSRRRVPLGMKVAAIGLVACLAVMMLLSLAARSGGGSADGKRGAGAGRTAVAKRVGDAKASATPGISTRAGVTGRRARRRVARMPVTVVVVRVPAVGPAVAVPVVSEASAAEARAAEDAHAEREFGP